MKRILLATMVAGLAACGGGGGGGGDPSPATLSGVASKGLVLNGVVIAEELKADGTVLRELGRTFTDPVTGAYTIALSATPTGPVVVHVEPRTSGGTTTMVCDVSGGCGAGAANALGAHIPVAANFRMEALVPAPAAGTTVTAAITPLTNMAAARARKLGIDSGALTSAAAETANAEMAVLVGAPVLSTLPVDPNNIPTNATQDQKTYSAFLAAVGQIAGARPTAGVETDFSTKLVGALADLKVSFEDGALDATDDYDASDIITAVQNQTGSGGLTGLATGNTDLSTQISTVTGAVTSGGGTFTPAPPCSASAVLQAKCLVDDARTFTNSVKELEQPAQTFSTEMDTAQTLTDQRFDQLFTSVSNVMDALGTAINTDPTFGPPGTSVTVNNYTFAVGNGSTVVITVTDANTTDNLDYSMTLDTGLTPAQWQLVRTKTWLNLGTPSATLTGSAVLRSTPGGAKVASFTFTNVHSSAGPITRADVDAEVTSLQAINAGGTGTLKDEVSNLTWTGTFGLETVALAASANRGTDIPTSLRKVTLNGTFTGLQRSFEADFTFTLNNPSAFDFFAMTDSGGDGFASINPAGDVLGAQAYATAHGITAALSYVSYSNGALGGTPVANMGNKTCFYKVGVLAPTCFNGDVLNAATYLRTHLPDYARPNPTGASDVNLMFGFGFTQINGRLEYPPFESEGYFANVTVTGSFTATFPDPFGSATVAVTVNRTQWKGGNAQFSVTRAGRTFKVTTTADPATKTVTVTIENPTGMKFTLTKVDKVVTGNVMLVDGGTSRLVGTVEKTNTGLLLMRYSDGTMASIQ